MRGFTRTIHTSHWTRRIVAKAGEVVVVDCYRGGGGAFSLGRASFSSYPDAIRGFVLHKHETRRIVAKAGGVVVVEER